MEEENKKRKLKPFTLFLLSVVLIGFALGMTFYSGMLFSCGNGGGRLLNFQCVQPVNIGVCESLTGGTYLIDDYYYKELYANGTLSEENYTEEYIENLTN